MEERSEVPRLAEIEVTNVRGLAKLDLTFPEPPRASDGTTRETGLEPAEVPLRADAAVLIGRNGTNKSTLLRAIAVGTGSRRDASAMLSASPGSLVGPNSLEAKVTLTYRYPNGDTVTATRVMVRDSANFDDVVRFEGPSADELVAGFSWDVEHFRPKGSVAEAPTHSGYYWLAYTWTNLYPSCAFCNQRRKDQPTFVDPTIGAATGKLDQFPLVDESRRAFGPGDALGNEEPKILDPCGDAPDQHLMYDAAGSMTAKNGSIRGTATVSVFGLNRRRLVRQRLVMLRQLARQIDDLVAAVVSRRTVTSVVLTANSTSDHQYSGMIAAARDDPPAFGF